MEKSMAKARPEEIDYEKYVIKKSVEEYWRAEEKVQLVVTGNTRTCQCIELQSTFVLISSCTFSESDFFAPFFLS